MSTRNGVDFSLAIFIGGTQNANSIKMNIYLLAKTVLTFWFLASEDKEYELNVIGF